MEHHGSTVQRFDNSTFQRCFVDFAQHVIEFAACDVALHLFIPVVVFPAVQPGSEFGTLCQRELVDGFLDLINAHEVELLAFFWGSPPTPQQEEELPPPPPSSPSSL